MLCRTSVNFVACSGFSREAVYMEVKWEIERAARRVFCA